MRNLVQFAPIFAAAGVRLNFNSKTGELEVVEPVNAVVTKAISEIGLYLDTANYQDGLAAIVISDLVDNDTNPIAIATRENVLTSLGIMRDGRYVAQALALQKTNRSWHTSEKPGECTYFGEACTHRGTVNVPGKRGRKATRAPDEYHRVNGSGVIGREQLISPALEALWNAIPKDNLTSEKPKVVNLERLLKNITPEQLAEIIEIKEREMALSQERPDVEH